MLVRACGMERLTVVVGDDVVAESPCGMPSVSSAVSAVERRVGRIPASEHFSESKSVCRVA